MHLTKYEHACLTLEKDGQLLVIDPGGFSSDFIAPANVVAVVITHDHGDHLDHDQLAGIIDKNPDALIIGDQAVTSTIEAFATRTVQSGDRLTIGEFDLEFFGGQHAVVYTVAPTTTNLGVMVNDLFYYPGDSFTLPGKPVDVLALPIAAPWLKADEVREFMLAIKPRLAFPTHDALLSDIGKSLPDRQLPQFGRPQGIDYMRLTGPLDI